MTETPDIRVLAFKFDGVPAIAIQDPSHGSDEADMVISPEQAVELGRRLLDLGRELNDVTPYPTGGDFEDPDE